MGVVAKGKKNMRETDRQRTGHKCLSDEDEFGPFEELKTTMLLEYKEQVWQWMVEQFEK